MKNVMTNEDRVKMNLPIDPEQKPLTLVEHKQQMKRRDFSNYISTACVADVEGINKSYPIQNLLATPEPVLKAMAIKLTNTIHHLAKMRLSGKNETLNGLIIQYKIRLHRVMEHLNKRPGASYGEKSTQHIGVSIDYIQYLKRLKRNPNSAIVIEG